MLNYKPQAKTRALLDDVQQVLADCGAAGLLPLSVRAIYYRLLATGKYAKDATLSEKVSVHLSNARRAGMIPWSAVYDSSEKWERPWAENSAEDFAAKVRQEANYLRLDRQRGQDLHLLVWCEAAGMVPMLANIADEYGVGTLSTSGYDSTTVRHKVGRWAGGLEVPLHVLHVGDLDPHGLQIFRAAAEDTAAWAEHYGGEAVFHRMAVTPEQVATFALPDDPDKPGNVQAEALPPAAMRDLLTEAITSRMDMATFADVLESERAARIEAYELLGGDAA